MSPAPHRLAATRPLTWKVGLFALVISFFWSGNIVSIKFGLATIPPFWSAFWRMAIGALAVSAWAWALRKPIRVERDQLRDFLLLGAMFTAQIAIFNLSVHYTSPAYAVILLNTNPVMVNLISHHFVKADRLSGSRLLGLGIAFGGISYVMFGQPDATLAPNPMVGNPLMLVSSFLLALRIVYTQRMVRRVGPYRPVIWQMVLSLPGFLALALAFEEPLLKPLTYEPVLAILYQALVVAGFCFVSWTSLLRLYSAGNLAMYTFSVPIFGIFLAAALFDERITGRLLVGAVAVAACIAIVTKLRFRGPSRAA